MIIHLERGHERLPQRLPLYEWVTTFEGSFFLSRLHELHATHILLMDAPLGRINLLVNSIKDTSSLMLATPKMNPPTLAQLTYACINLKN